MSGEVRKHRTGCPAGRAFNVIVATLCKCGTAFALYTQLTSTPGENPDEHYDGLSRLIQRKLAPHGPG